MILDIFKKKKSVETPNKMEEIASVLKTKIPKNHKYDTPTFIKSNKIGGTFNDIGIGSNKTFGSCMGTSGSRGTSGIHGACSIPGTIGGYGYDVIHDSTPRYNVTRNPHIMIDSSDIVDVSGLRYVGKSKINGNSIYEYMGGGLEQIKSKGYNYEELLSEFF
jgi:hypothetical protein